MSRFFHSLVVFGAGASLAGCGGQTTGGVQSSDPGVGGAGGDGGGGAGCIGPCPAAGGALFAGSGGRKTSAGGSGVALGGVPGGSVDAGDPFLNSLVHAQWNCDGLSSGCTSVPVDPDTRRFSLTAACPIDPSRPRSPFDCKSGDLFSCRAAELRGQPMSVNCECVAPPAGGACAACADPMAGRYRADAVSCGSGVELCGCAITAITR